MTLTIPPVTLSDPQELDAVHFRLLEIVDGKVTMKVVHDRAGKTVNHFEVQAVIKGKA